MIGYLLDLFSRNKFMGVNMNRWAYLGSSSFQYRYENSNRIHAETDIFFFCLKKNPAIRKYVLPKNINPMLKEHSFLTVGVQLWMVGEHALELIINNSPSKWLKQYMLEKYNEDWDEHKGKWVTAHTIETADDNVVKLSFPKTKKELDPVT